jgi:hypothetical protein
MTQTNVYQPGVCNIGPAEIRRRRSGGIVGLVVAVVFLALAFLLHWPAPVRLLVALPVGLAASGILQSAMHFCAGFGSKGLFNFGELGTEEHVMDAAFRKKDQRKATLILTLTAVIAVVVAVVAWLIQVA